MNTKIKVYLTLTILSFLACTKDYEISKPETFKVSIEEISSGSEEILTDISFGDANTAYICGANGSLLKSINSGLSWNQVQTELYQSLNCIQALNSRQVYMARNDLYYSDNSGKTWNGKGLDLFGSQIHELLFLSSSVGFILKNGIMKTINSGTTWNSVFDAGNDPNYYLLSYKKIQFVDTNIGFCAGGKSYDNTSLGNILKTTNGGETWMSLNFETSDITALYFFDPLVGYVFNFNKELWKTTNGGNSWTKISSTIPYSYPDCYFINQDTIIIRTVNEIYHSIDQGVTWIKDYTFNNPEQILTRMKFFENKKGYMIGHDGFIAKSAFSQSFAM